MKKIHFILMSWLTIPHVIVYLLFHEKKILNKDIERWTECTHICHNVTGGEKTEL